MNYLLDVENEHEDGYLDYPGPFIDFPSSLLEDLIDVLNDKRRLPKQMLHQIIQPQLKSYTIRATTSKHIQTNLLGSKCRDLKRLNFTNSKSIAPNFYIKFMTKFPNLLVIDFQGTILDNESFNSIGETCIKLKELNASGTTITDTGLQYLTSSISSDATIKVRCPSLQSINLTNTRVSSVGVAGFLFFHPTLVYLHYEDLSQVFSHMAKEDFSSLYGAAKFQPAFNLRKLTFSDGKIDEPGFKAALSSCPFVDTIVVKKVDIPPYLLQEMMTISTISSLHIGNSPYPRCLIHFHDDILPLLLSLGSNLTSLNLDKFTKIDILQIGNFCIKLKYLRLSCIGSYVPVIDHSKQIFKNLEEIELLNTRGAHVYTKLIHQLLDNATKLKHAKFQFVDTLNDEVLSGILSINPLFNLESFTLDQCHSISSFSLEDLLSRKNKLIELAIWSCRFVTETDKEHVVRNIKTKNFDIHFSWYPFTGEEAPMAIDDIISDDGDDDSDEETDDDANDDEPEFLNYWNNPPLPSQQINNIPLD